MNYQCLIVADQVPVINTLTKYINTVDLLKLVDICTDEAQAIKVLEQSPIDLLLIHLGPAFPNLLGRKFKKYTPKVIINTAEPHFTIRANELEVINYLMQPHSISAFTKAITRMRYLNDLDTKAAAFLTPEFIYFRSQRKMVKVILNEIIYVESTKDYITVHTDRNPPLKIKQSISSLETILPPKKFIRIHRSYIVSISKITAFNHYDVEIDNLELPIGRKYKEVYSRLKSN